MGRIGVVLGAGGVVGQAYHAGVLAAISHVTGFDPRAATVIVGTSAGSVAAAGLRGGATAEDLFARATGRPLSPAGQALLGRVPAPSGQPARAERQARLGPSSPELLGRLFSRPLPLRPALAVTALLPEGRRDTSEWFAGFDTVFAAGRWPGAATYICAVDLDRGGLVVFGRPGAPTATVAQAVQASCAIPAVFAPAVIGGTRYVDGGVHSPTNADLVAGLGLDAVVISSPMSAYSRPSGQGGGISRTALTQLRMAARFPAARLLRREVRLLQDGGVPVLTFEPTSEVMEAMGLQPMDFRRRAPVAEAALAAASLLLDGAAGREVGRILMKAHS